MRYLLLTRGMPLCGKTTWIQEHNLQDYTLCSKLFKSLTQSPMLSENGHVSVSNCNEKLAFQMLCSALEVRMSRGDFVIIEDTHITKSYFSNYKEMAKIYAYKIIIVDFSTIPLEDILQRHKQFAKNTDMPFSETNLQALHNELLTTAIPIKCDTITPDKITCFLNQTPKNLNGYKIIHHIGDIQGSYAVLKKYLHTMKDDEFYIFLGDYIDRGFQNYEVLEFLLSIMDKKNVCLLEGNHEKWLWEWANNREVESKEFHFNTKIELEAKNFNKHDARRLYHKLQPYLFYKFHDKHVICTHGGISNIPKYFPLLSASQTIHGVGSYLNASNIAQSFAKNAPDGYYQMFGHRNKTDLPLCLYKKSFILESQVEFGGYLRTVQLSQNGFKNTSVRNTIFVAKEEKEEKLALQKFFYSATKNKKITLHTHKNFAMLSYAKKITNDILRLTYPFYPCIIDTKNWRIAGRGYDLNANKTALFETEKNNLIQSLEFPLIATRKQNGVLLLVTYYDSSFHSFYHSQISKILPKCLESQKIQTTLVDFFENKSHSLLFTQTSENSLILFDVFANHTNTMLNQAKKEQVAKILQIAHLESEYIINDSESLHALWKQKDIYEATFIKNQNTELYLRAFLKNEMQTKPNTNYTALKGFRIHDCAGNFFELPSPYERELRVIKHFIEIWNIQNAVTKLPWINNPLRESFFTWFQNYTAHNEKWRSTQVAWIQNAFLQSLENLILR